MRFGNIICTRLNGEDLFYVGTDSDNHSEFSPLRSKAKFLIRYEDAIFVSNMLMNCGIDCHIELFRKTDADDIIASNGQSECSCDDWRNIN